MNIEELKKVCEFDLIPSEPGTINIKLCKWPPFWWRFWTRIFFGWKVTAIK